MSTLGDYQDNIEELDTLSITNYERIFKIFTLDNDDKQFYFYNILKKIVMPDNINSDYIEYYDNKSPAPLTLISHRIYNDIKLWWLIALLNKDKLQSNLFVVPGGTQLQYLTAEALPLVFAQITKITIKNGRHY